MAADASRPTTLAGVPLDEIVIATGNPHKVEEIAAILRAPGIRITGLADLPDAPDTEPIEDGATFEANALLKARWYADRLGRACLADDSGLEVDALAGAPGVRSARYAEDLPGFASLDRALRDRRNRDKLLAALEGKADEARAARFVCAMALVAPNQPEPLAAVRGTFEGRIGIPPRVPSGDHGFGYDPLFLVAPSFDRTSAELDPAEKNRMSHRARACGLLAAAMGWI